MKLSINAPWIELLWSAMQKSGKGYRKHSLKRTGIGLDRRGDKLKDGAVILENKLQRKARNGLIGVKA